MINKNTVFLQAITPDKKIKIKIRIDELSIVLDKAKFINTYKISNIFRGKFFVKRLIKKIFKYQLKQKIVWKKNIWKKICIYKAKISFISKIDKHSMINYINENTNSKRLKDINQYKDLLINKKQLNSPLYITYDCISYLGGSDDTKKVFILDGSRRFVANLLCGYVPEIFIIDLIDENSK